MPVYLNVVLLLSWLAAHYQTLVWLLAKISSRPDTLALGALVAVALIWAISKVRVNAAVASARAPLVLFFVVALLGILNFLTIQFTQLQVTFLLLGIYAWIGMQQSIVAKWQKALSIVILLSLLIPFYLEFSSGLGFGLRLVTAHLVELTLRGMGLAAVSSSDVIIIENTIAHVDVPCSGLKSLWVGSAFYLAALIIMGIRITWIVLWKYFAVVILLLSVNTLRILILTVVTAVYGMPKIAEVLHLPLGMLGFSLSCLVGWYMLRQERKRNHVFPLPVRIASGPFVWCFLLLNFVQIGLSMQLGAPLKRTLQPFVLPTSLHAEPLSLTPAENNYFSRGQSTVAAKWRVRWRDLTGSLLTVDSLDFNMFHAPELCMSSAGAVVDAKRSFELADLPKGQFAVLSLNHGSATGIYWLQSGPNVTDDFLSRYFQYVFDDRKNWHMISMVLPLAFPPKQSTLEDIVSPIYEKNKEK